MIYNNYVAPLYKDNKHLLEAYSEKIEKIFNQNSEAFKNKVAQSTGESIAIYICRIKRLYGRSFSWGTQPSSKASF